MRTLTGANLPESKRLAPNLFSECKKTTQVSSSFAVGSTIPLEPPPNSIVVEKTRLAASALGLRLPAHLSVFTPMVSA